jgi:LPXTG-motif cell wall-anchored protein
MKTYYLIFGIMVLVLCICPLASAAENATPKAVVLDLAFNNGVVDVIGSRVVNNYPPDNRASRDIVIRMLDKKGSLLAEQGIVDPRVIYLEEGAVLADKVNFSVIVAFHRELATIRLLNGTSGTEMVSADVSGTVNGYCNVHGSDPDCMVPGPDLTLIAGGIVIIVLLAGAGWYFLKKKRAPGQKPPAP